MSTEDFAGFRTEVLADAGLQRDLLATADRPSFVALVVERAGARGWDVEPADVEQALHNSRTAWLQRWI